MTLPGVHPEEGFSVASPKWRALVGQLRVGHWGRAVHMNNDAGGVAILRASAVRRRYGFTRAVGWESPEDGVSGWPAYLVSSARGLRQLNRLHLSDVWREFLPREGDEPGEPPLSQGALLGPVVLVLSGRSVYRSLTEETVVRVLAAVIRLTGRQVVLVGRPDEWEIGERIRRIVGAGVSNLAGKTSIGELDGLIRESSLVISPDTATLHLASWRRIPTIGLFFGGAFPHETGARFGRRISIVSRMECFPCGGEGSGCQSISCREKIDGDLIGRVARSILEGFPLPPSSDDLCVLEGREGDGGFNTQEISGEPGWKGGTGESESAVTGVLFRRFFLRLLPGKRDLDPMSRSFGSLGDWRDEKTIGTLSRIQRGIDLFRAMRYSSVERQISLVNEFPSIWPLVHHLLLSGEAAEASPGGDSGSERCDAALSLLSSEIEEILDSARPGPFGGSGFSLKGAETIHVG
jgi:ADP-heptose:LPS heptosyltransferase